jgi:mono/diheme cytochrome c family protein
VALAAGGGPLAELAKPLVARTGWPGKPAPKNTAPPLTAAEERQVAAGEKVYANFCAGCHKADGTGDRGGATNIAASALVGAYPQALLRVILHGKEGATGLMPPLGAALNDDQVADVTSYIRRAWGRTASAVPAADVKETRGVNKLRKTPWTDAELKRFSVAPSFGR